MLRYIVRLNFEGVVSSQQLVVNYYRIIHTLSCLDAICKL